MNESTKRTLRTAAHVALAVAAVAVIAVPIIGASIAGASAVTASVVAMAAAVSKAWNALEDAGLIPAWLKDADAGIPVVVPTEDDYSDPAGDAAP